jgi:aspartyl-tRNA(Asn)/glutamyl-tRNA(Gln) amidotransferase subunit A
MTSTPKAGTLAVAESIRSGKRTAKGHLEERIKAVEADEGKVRAFLDTYFEDARLQAEKLDESIRAGKKVGPLAGLVVAVKNVIAIKDRRLTCGSKMLEHYLAPYDATVVERVRAADGIIIGATNCDEFACGSDTTKSAFHPSTFKGKLRSGRLVRWKRGCCRGRVLRPGPCD